jgi:hypothetical protein
LGGDGFIRIINRIAIKYGLKEGAEP